MSGDFDFGTFMDGMGWRKRRAQTPGENPEDFGTFAPNPAMQGAVEYDIASFTAKVLGEEDSNPIVTSDGRIVDRRRISANDRQNSVELLKQRIWGDAPPPFSFDVNFSDEAFSRIINESLAEPKYETGGALIGAWRKSADGEYEIEIERASGPGPQAEKNRGLFRPDMDYYRERATYFKRNYGWKYLGEWHKHPGAFRDLSGTDVSMARDLFMDEGWPFLVLPIVTVSREIFSMTVYVVSPRENGLSPRIEIVSEIKRNLENIRKGSCDVKLFVERSWMLNFIEGDASAVEYSGVYNPDASLVFLPVMGIKNARLRMVRQKEATLRSDPAEVLGILGRSGEIRFYNMHDGEARELEPVEIDSDQDVYSRNAGLLETLVLKECAVAIVGTGSVGSTVALELARAGVGRIALFDPDTLEPHNIARHQASLRDIGRLKVDAVAEMIKNISPYVKVDTYRMDITENQEAIDSFKDIANDFDLLICSTDTDESRLLINDVSLALDIPSLQIGLHERARSGIVQEIWPGDGACWLCHRNKVLIESIKRGDVAYSDAETSRDLTVQPGLSAQINMISEAGAVKAVDMLMRMDRKRREDFSLIDFNGEKPVEEGKTPNLTLVYIFDEDPEGSENRMLRMRTVHFDMEVNPECPACSPREDANMTTQNEDAHADAICDEK